LVFDVWFAAALTVAVTVAVTAAVTVAVTAAWARPQRHAAHCNMSNHSLHCTAQNVGWRWWPISHKPVSRAYWAFEVLKKKAVSTPA